MVNNGIVTAPISVKDPYTCMGVGATANGYDLGYICSNSHGKINKWAKNKPVRHEKIIELTEDEKLLRNAGIDISSTLTYTANDLISKATANLGWNYLSPRGGSYNEPYRLTDFIGYNHNAGHMFTYYVPESIPTTGTTLATTLNFQINPNAELKLTDFIEFSDNANLYYYGIAYYMSTDKVYLARGPKVSEVINGNIDIDITFRNLGQWKCIFCVTMDEGMFVGGNSTAYIPNGVFDVKVYRVYIYADVTITKNFSGLWMDNNGIYGFIYPTISITDDGDYFPESNGLLTLKVYYYVQGSTTPIGSFDVDDYSNNQFSFVGTGTKDLTVDFLNGNNILFNKYAPGVDFSNVGYVKIEASVKVLSGNGVFRMKGTYKWTISK